jgi:multidrug efflux pump subunit AcrA (membrane-fusion protein)
MKVQNFEHLTPEKKIPRLSVVQSLLMGMGFGALFALGATRLIPQPQKAAPVPAKIQPIQGLAVTTAKVQLTPVNQTLKATGTVTAVEMIPILSQSTGLQIEQILVDEGDYVQVGQLLARLDDSIPQAQKAQEIASIAESQAKLAELNAGSRREEIQRAKETVNRIQAEIQQAQSDWDLAKKRVERNQTLQIEGAIAQDRLDEVLNEERSKKALLQQAQARLREAQAQLAQLEAGPRLEVKAQAIAQLAAAKSRLQLVEAQLKNTRVISPVRGKIVKRNAKLGDITSSQTPLFEIIEDNRLELQLKVPENQLKTLRIGQSVTIYSDSDNRIQLEGEIREIYPTVDANSRQALIKVSLPGDTSLKPGMFLEGAIITKTATSKTIPMEAVLPQADGTSLVYVLQADNTVRSQRVKIGEIMADRRVEILEGLNPGDQVIVKGGAYLKDGDAVLAK